MQNKNNDVSKLDPHDFIIIKGASMHNLKRLDVAIPRNKFVVITGLSGSGKSSLAFDTLYAEGQRRYVESLSSYARQFIGRMDKPEVDYILGISPAVAIQQKVNSRNPRSTVGTGTEIYDYLKLLFARVGKTFSPVSGQMVRKQSVSDVVDFITDFKQGRFLIACPLMHNPSRAIAEDLNILLQKGFNRLLVDGEVKEIEEVLKEPVEVKKEAKAAKKTVAKKSASKKKVTEVILPVVQPVIYPGYHLLIDRIGFSETPDEELIARIADSVQTAFNEGVGTCCIFKVDSEQSRTLHTFSNRFELDGISFEEPSVHLFSFNNPYGACRNCEGFGSIIGIDDDLVIPDKSLSIYEGAIVCWKGEKMKEWNDTLVMNAYKFDFPVHKPFFELSDFHKELVWTGNKYFKGLNQFFKYLEEQTYKIQYRVMLSRYRGKTVCPECKGTRLRLDANYVRVAGKSMSEIVLMPVKDVLSFFNTIQLDENDAQIGKRLFTEILSRLQFLDDVGLGYLTLNRLSNSLSGGESQRINLATSLGSTLVGSMYILDEPSIGLHPRDTQRLIKVLKSLREVGNTLIVVEHDEEIMRASDQLIDIGPMAGMHGGELVFQGTCAELEKDKESLTGRYLSGKETIPVPKQRRIWKKYIEVKGARENNLKHVNVKFPMGVMTVITGVSGSGKTSLVKKILYPALKKILGGYGEATGNYDRLDGNYHDITAAEMIDQNPIGKSSSSNPITYIKAFDEIRNLFSDLPLARQRSFKPSHFSFNVEGGRCDMCQGEGVITVEMQFMADIYLKCEYCKGKRFKEEVLAVEYRGYTVFDILDMTVDEALEFFSEGSGPAKYKSLHQKITAKIQPLADVGLGYIRLGQSSSTLSGGEAQRIKLASFLGKGNYATNILFVFDEPTTGLHFHDISKLLKAFDALVKNGNTLIIIEHNLEIIKCADWLIDIGPEGGSEGGHIVFEGLPEDLVKVKKSHTAKFLKGKI
ncbi:MAG: excinuclease ABC subunit UvrA [Bacteroidetes bacterium]|nr:excinuclease ABC subunit UvrA [Bacteroidota bacterium]